MHVAASASQPSKSTGPCCSSSHTCQVSDREFDEPPRAPLPRPFEPPRAIESSCCSFLRIVFTDSQDACRVPMMVKLAARFEKCDKAVSAVTTTDCPSGFVARGAGGARGAGVRDLLLSSCSPTAMTLLPPSDGNSRATSKSSSPFQASANFARVGKYHWGVFRKTSKVFDALLLAGSLAMYTSHSSCKKAFNLSSDAPLILDASSETTATNFGGHAVIGISGAHE
mmetsp:Transcript_25104/g.45422  ORF Transcript_25104/g.45422 Transcript_25104/m.45422 type:complete len:226 (-) Transcript_25104:121-798(-)